MKPSKIEPSDGAKKISRRKTLAIDLDGIILEYDGWKGPKHFGKIIEGVKERLEKLSRDNDLILFSTRVDGYKHLVNKQLFLEGILEYFIKVTAVKPPADFFLDDKCCSSWEELEEKLGTTSPGVSIWNSIELNAVAKDIIFNLKLKEEKPKPKSYNRFLVSLIFFVSGAALIFEHLITWHGFDFSPGHEWLGLILIIISFIVGLKKR